MNPFLYSMSVDLVDFGDINLFMFIGDNLYDTAVPPDRKNRSLDKYQEGIRINGYPPSQLNQHNIGQALSAKDGVFILLNHLWDNEIEFTILDIGSFIGDFSCKVGNFIRTFGKTTKVISFDPTIAGTLVNYNIELNGLEKIVKHEDLAIAENDGLVMFSYSHGNTDSASIISRRGPETPSEKMDFRNYLNRFRKAPPHTKLHLLRNFIVRRLRSAILGQYYSQLGKSSIITHSMSILSYLSQKAINTNLFVKIDIEGFDHVVVRDLIGLLPTRLISIITEFNPGFYRADEDASLFLRDLCSRFYVYDICYSPNPAWFRLIDPKDFDTFTKDVREKRKYGYTDLLLLDKRTPQCDKVMRRLDSLTSTVEQYVL